MEPTDSPNIAASAPSVEAPKKKSSIGGVLAIVIVLAALVGAAFYFWGERISDEAASTEQQLEDLGIQDTSTDAASIEADLNAQSPDDFDSDFEKAFGELEASFGAE